MLRDGSIYTAQTAQSVYRHMQQGQRTQWRWVMWFAVFMVVAVLCVVLADAWMGEPTTMLELGVIAVIAVIFLLGIAAHTYEAGRAFHVYRGRLLGQEEQPHGESTAMVLSIRVKSAHVLDEGGTTPLEEGPLKEEEIELHCASLAGVPDLKKGEKADVLCLTDQLVVGVRRGDSFVWL